MIKYIVILFAIFILVQSQRPPYAGSSKPYPGVLPQYLDAQVAAAAAAPAPTTGATSTAAATGTGTDTTVINRIDTNTDSSTALGAAMPTTTTTSTIPPDLPIDALGDVDLINRIKTWPREKQPFWYINWQQIQEHRGDTKNRAPQVLLESNTRSFFAG